MAHVDPLTVVTELRRRFEDAMRSKFEKSGVDLTRTKAGCYRCKRIQLWWCGYKLAHDDTIDHLWSAPKPVCRFIIGRVVDNGSTRSFSMATRPHRHIKRVLAKAEAERLIQIYGGEFAIFKCVDIVGTPTPVPEIN